MILSQDVLNRIEFYEAEHFSQSTPMHSTIVIHWKRNWKCWRRNPVIIKTNCRQYVAEDGGMIHDIDSEWEELSDQLREHFLRLARAPRRSGHLFSINGGKKDE